MKTSKNLLKDQRGMTGLETAIILIAFVTVAAVFSYAVLSAGLFSAERGKETIYSGLQEARSNLEVCGSVMATSTDSASVSKIIFTVKNAIAGTPVDLTACDGTSSAANKCVISLTTSKDYFNNVKWTRTAVGTSDGDNLLEPGEMFEISVNLNDLGIIGSLSENLTANKTFSLQVKPAVGASITVQRTLPASISSVMDLDLGIGGNGGSGSGGSTGGGTASFELTSPTVTGFSSGDHVSVVGVLFNLTNTGTTDIVMSRTSGCTVNMQTSGGLHLYNMFYSGSVLIAPGASGPLTLDIGEGDLLAGDLFTVEVIPLGGSTLSFTRTVPNPISSYSFNMDP